MEVVQAGPGLYLHARKSLQVSGPNLREIGRTALVITGYLSFKAAGSRLLNTLDEVNIHTDVCHYSGECSDAEAQRILRQKPGDWDMIIGLGGGKVIDLGKLVAELFHRPYVAIPTLPSTCAPAAPVAVVYDDAGKFKASRILSRPPAVTIVDDEVLINAPPRTFLSGIADTLAKKYEARVSARNSSVLVTCTGMWIAEEIAEAIMSDTEVALAQMGNSDPRIQFHNLVDAVVLLGSMVGGVGGDACRGAAAHAMHDSLTTHVATSQATHGEKVAYGLLVQLTLSNSPPCALDELRSFYRKVGLPCNWRELTHTPIPNTEELVRLASFALVHGSSMHRMVPVPTVDEIVRSMLVLESWAG